MKKNRKCFPAKMDELNTGAHHPTPWKLNALVWSPKLITEVTWLLVQFGQCTAMLSSISSAQVTPDNIYTPPGPGPAGVF